MVVEGETVNRSIVLKQLEQLGLKVTCCDTAQDALAQIDDSVDLVLTDHIMPEMDGFDLASALRAAHNEVAIIIVSSNTSLADNDPARALVSAILKKPIPRSDLFSQLSDIKIIASKKSSAPLRKMRILAAEDNKTNQLVFSKMIQHLDVDLRIANNGEEAVDLYQSFIPDMIFMDISMPKMDGKEASMAIRQIEETKGVRCPIVALTAHAMSGDDKSILAAGLDHYLTKPLRKTDIVSQIEQNQPDGTRPLEPDAPQQATG
tara:strand:- start:6434 stop:7219 length:786 start_codon:yes stop_codon:yes gene_type:complete